MASSEKPDQESVKPSEQRGGTTPDEMEAREKGLWAATASEGIVPAELGGSDAPHEMLGEDPTLRRSIRTSRPSGIAWPPRSRTWRAS
jgi:hypothetical protein